MLISYNWLKWYVPDLVEADKLSDVFTYHICEVEGMEKKGDDTVFDINTLLGIFLQGLISGVMGIASAVLVLYLLKNRELAEVWATLHAKIWRAKVVPPDAEIL